MDGRHDSPRSTSEAANDSSTPSNMFSSNSYFGGGTYYHVRGDAHFLSSLSQVSGLEILHRHISASACHDSRERFPPPRCHPSTRKEILATIMDHIMDAPERSRILYVFGSEGTGKSAIAQTIAELCKSIGILGACFFFSRASSDRNTDRNLTATLAYQLCATVPELKRFIVKAVEDDLSTFQKDVHTQIEKLIVNPIIQAANEDVILRNPILIVVDGLDECEGVKEQRTLLRAINAAMEQHHLLALYFFITSRPDTRIVNWLNQDHTIHPISLYLGQNPIQTKRDIEVYLRSEFERIRKDHDIFESLVWPSESNIQTLVSKANILFSCASEIIASIDDQKSGDTPQYRLKVILQSSSSGGHSSATRSEILPGLATSATTNYAQLNPNPGHREKTSTVFAGRVEVDGLRYRRRPNIGSDAIGQYPIGTEIGITGFTEEGTSVVKGDARWARLSNGYWVALANGKYVSWTGSIPQCH